MRPLVTISLSLLSAIPALAQPLAFTESAVSLGCTHTFSPNPGYPGTHDQMVGGLTVADFNHDGRPDLYALGGGDQPDRLFLNTSENGIPAFAEADPSPAGWNLTAPHRGASLAAGDVNRDGLMDLYIVSYGPAGEPRVNNASMLLLNRGGRFERVTAGVERVANAVDGTSATLGDIDNDGDLDLFVTAWASNAGGNRLFLNQGSNIEGVPQFTDATLSMDVDLSPVRGYTARMADLNDDRLPDLLINGDFGTSRLLINLGLGADNLPRFADATAHAGLTADHNAMGLALADADNDGDLDWFITNIYSSFTGNTNTLYLNQGLAPLPGTDAMAPVFTDAAQAASVTNAGWGWGAVFADLDGDTDLDLAVTGGWFQYPPTPARLYRNDGVIGSVPRFTETAAQSGFTFSGLGRTLVTLDIEGDGDLDLAMSAKGSPLRLFLNTTPADHNRITLALDTSAHPCLAPAGRHARVEIDTTNPDGSTLTQIRVLDGGPTYLGHGQLIAHFGIAQALQADEARLILHDGSSRTFFDLAANTRHTLAVFHPADLTEDGTIDAADLVAFVNAFLAGQPTADLDRSGLLDLADVVRFVHAASGTPCE